MGIERWITVNGAHIPIMSGESRTKAVANFIKSKRAGRGRNVKGYSTDPYQKERKANKAYSETYKTFDKFVEDNENNYKQIRDENQKRMGVAREQLKKKYPNYMKNDLDYAKYQNEHRLKESEARYKETLADSKIRNAVALRELESRASYMDELNKGYSGYKLKAGKETPAKRTIKGVGKTDTMKQADEKYFKARTNADWKARERLSSNPLAVGETWDKYKRSYKAANTKRTKAYTYKMTDDNRRKMINDLGNKVTKLDRQVENAKTDSAFRRLQKKQERTQKAINTFGGKYIVGRKKKK